MKKISDVYCCLVVPIVRILGDGTAFFILSMYDNNSSLKNGLA